LNKHVDTHLSPIDDNSQHKCHVRFDMYT